MAIESVAARSAVDEVVASVTVDGVGAAEDLDGLCVVGALREVVSRGAVTRAAQDATGNYLDRQDRPAVKMSVTAITANSKTMRLIAPAAVSLAATAVAVLCS